MKLHTDNQGFEGNLPDNRIKFQIKQSAKLFSILSDGLYKNKILAVIREYVCNAYDAHVMSGKKDVPFTVQLPNQLNHTFAVIDQGTGIDPDKIGEIFWTYGESSKTNDENTIGALGLGSKSAFAYTKSSFIVKNRYQGTEYVYFCFINENGEPEGSLVGQELTEESSGITIEFATKPEDTRAFYDCFGRIFKYWHNVKPNIVGTKPHLVFANDPIKVIEGTNWYLEKPSANYGSATIAMAIMGNVAYPIEYNSIPNMPDHLKMIASNPFVITFPLGDLEFAASREDLSYTEFTCKQIIKRLQEVSDNIEKSFQDKIYACNDHVSFYTTVQQTFEDIKKHIRIQEQYTNNVYPMLLFGKKFDDYVEFKGSKLKIENLTCGMFTYKVPTYQSFGLNRIIQGTLSTGFNLKPSTTLDATTMIKISSSVLFPEQNIDDAYDIEEGVTKLYDSHWKPKVKTSKEDKSLLDSIVNASHLFTFNTKNRFSVFNNLTFIINDVPSGHDRMKLIYKSQSTMTANKLNKLSLVFVQFNAKVNSLEQVEKELNELISTSLTGAAIVKLSTLPDLRPAVAKVKTSKGTVKLKAMHTFSTHKNSVNVSNQYINSSYVQSAYVQMNEQLLSTPKDEIFEINNLLNKKVMYVRKSGSYMREGRGDYDLASINTKVHLNYAMHLNLLDDLMVDNEYSTSEVDANGVTTVTVKTKKTLKVLVLTDTQFDNLVKKGVKLTTFKEYVKDKIVALNKIEQFDQEIKRYCILSNTTMIKEIHHGFMSNKGNDTCFDQMQTWSDSNSLFKSMMYEYHDISMNCAKHSSSFIKTTLLNAMDRSSNLSTTIDASEYINKLNDRYPMLMYAGYGAFYASKKGAAVIKYVEQIDSLIEMIVKQARADMISVEKEFA